MSTLKNHDLEFLQLNKLYDPAAYDSLPSLREAHCQMTEDTMAKLHGPIRDVFLRNKVHDRYGICLNHSHFPMASDRRLVEHGPVSIPMEMGSSMENTTTTFNGIIHPRSIRLFGGKLAPYEFSFHSQKPQQLHHEFLSEAFSLIRDLGLHNHLGIRCFEEHDTRYPVEITQGNANVMVPLGAYPSSELIDAFWIFTEDDNDRCHCREQCFPLKDRKHEENHSCG